ncbi:MAG: CaiB/BaiF CoA-transferase family protein [Bacillota bacterium]|nr:CaiB/BaiF CoA-transferase family protein [Bacillota bacterium]MDP4171828.1 CaiB/BaiF CoA-transferase family protein [Bacillota bacterium]
MLSGIVIIDFSNYLPGPFATLRLAEMGAEVIKIEPLSGDPSRSTGPQKDGKGLVFLANNRGKKSITINLKENEGRELALRLIAGADVVLESFRPGVMEKLGLGYEKVRALKPDIIYCSISGYGQQGDMSKLGSHDLNYMALSGVLSQFKDENGRPVHPSITMADYVGGMAANERILAGLVSRSLNGKSSYHSISITEAMASMLGNHLLVEKETGEANGISVLNGSIISYVIYETLDGRYVSLAALEPKFWRNFCFGVNREEWIEAHFSKTIEDNPVYFEVKKLFKSRSFQEWVDFSIKVDCCLTPVLEVGELRTFPYFLEKKTVAYDGQVKMHSDFEMFTIAPPPYKGEHTDSVLKKFLGVSDEEISMWKKRGII